MFSTTDTIVAVATPPGRGGIGVVRLSGPGAHDVAGRLIGSGSPLRPRYATLAVVQIEPGSARAIDQAIVTYFPAPHSYTGDDVVEISAHGSPIVLQTIVRAAVVLGARVAGPGEFTLRAFLNGRMDLPQAEAVADLIEAATPLQAHAAFDQLNGTLTGAIAAIDATLFDLIARLEASVDFPEEGYHFVEPAEVATAIDAVLAQTTALLADARRGRLLREGFSVAIVGRPNVGKSSLFNALVGAPRTIVNEMPGTTRDLVSETIDLHGLRVTIVDTAGIRETKDPVEFDGVMRSRRAAETADLVIRVSAASDPEPDDNYCVQDVEDNELIVINKIDLGINEIIAGTLGVSTKTGEGLDALRRQVVESLDVEWLNERPGITNIRHIALVERADAALRRARRSALSDGRSLPEEFVLADLQDARQSLEEITGRRTSDDLLAHIFSRFCVGK